jgi:N-methylhydantoinase A
LPTVTDANLVLGRFGGAQLLGGDFKLDPKRARDVLEQLAREMSAASGRRTTAHEAALGVVRVVNAGMERALRVVSIERGYDSRSFALVSFGGAGGLHAVALAESLRIPRVIVPQRPGALSALGALASDVVMDASRTVMLDAAGARTGELERAFREMERAARAALKREGFSDEGQRHARSVAARYKGQSFELEIEWKSAERLAAAFHRAHLARYGYAQAESGVEIVSARLRSRGLVGKLKRERAERNASASVVAPCESALVYFTSTPARVGVYARERLRAGARLETPCIVTEYSSTTLVPPGAREARVDADGNLIIEL